MARTRRIRRGESSPAGVEVVSLTLTGMAPTGEAIGRHAGLVVFVPFGLPGEEVIVRLVERKRDFARGEIIQRMTDAATRVVPVCPYFGRCGGCDWQHVTCDEQLRIKTAIVAEQLARIGKLADPPVLPCVGSPSAYEYRNHTRLHVTADEQLGYRAARSHTIVPVTDCPILEPQLRRRLGQLATGCDIPQGTSEIELRTWGDAVEVAGFAYRTSERVFFQANTAIAGLLVEALLAALAPSGGERVLDLYCGVGLFTVPVGQRVAQIVGVESGSTAAADAVLNLDAASVPGRILVQDVAKALRDPIVTSRAWDAIVLDPPRTGVDALALEALIALRAPRLFYISCEPATLARDLRALIDRGYTLEWAQPYDMFPQTRHVETFVVLTND